MYLEDSSHSADKTKPLNRDEEYTNLHGWFWLFSRGLPLRSLAQPANEGEHFGALRYRHSTV